MNSRRIGAAVTCFLASIALSAFLGCGPAASSPPSGPGTNVPTDNTTSPTQPFQTTAPFTGVRTLSVIDSNGDITVITDATASEVRITGIKSTLGPAGPEATERLDRIQILVQPVPVDTLQIEAVFPGDNTTPSSDRVDFTITVPAGAALDITAQTGAVTVGGNVGAVHVRNNLGDIVLTNGFGDVDVATGIGNLSLNNVNGNVAAVTTNGRIAARVTPPPLGRIDLASRLGPIEIVIPPGTPAFLTLNAANGTVITDFTGFTVTSQQQTGPGSLIATLNGGGGTILRAATANANIIFGQITFFP
jgi:hypothetical protein